MTGISGAAFCRSSLLRKGIVLNVNQAVSAAAMCSDAAHEMLCPTQGVFFCVCQLEEMENMRLHCMFKWNALIGRIIPGRYVMKSRRRSGVVFWRLVALDHVL